jgi:S-methylmethionine-dependent homocysteine/selenocysteine methylase
MVNCYSVLDFKAVVTVYILCCCSLNLIIYPSEDDQLQSLVQLNRRISWSGTSANKHEFSSTTMKRFSLSKVRIILFSDNLKQSQNKLITHLSTNVVGHIKK